MCHLTKKLLLLHHHHYALLEKHNSLTKVKVSTKFMIVRWLHSSWKDPESLFKTSCSNAVVLQTWLRLVPVKGVDTHTKNIKGCHWECVCLTFKMSTKVLWKRTCRQEEIAFFAIHLTHRCCWLLHWCPSNFTHFTAFVSHTVSVSVCNICNRNLTSNVKRYC